MPVPDSLPGVALLALCASLPVVVVGALVIRLARSWSVTVSMVALVLIPTLATYAGVFWASRCLARVRAGMYKVQSDS